MTVRRTSFAVAVVALGVAGGAAWAQGANEGEAANAPTLSFDQAIEIALAEQPGMVEEVEIDREDGRSVFEIEIEVEGGEEVEVTLDAETGEILELEREGKGWFGDDDDGDDDGDGQADRG